GTAAPVWGGTADRLTVAAGGRSENAPAGDRLFVPNRGLQLCPTPSVEIFSTVHRHAQQHLGVLRPAILRALAEKDAGAIRIHPHLVYPIRNQVGFTGKLRNPEAVVSVGGKQLQECWLRTCRIAHGNVQLVCRHDPEPWIPKLPPELVP